MGRLKSMLVDNATDLLFTFSAFLIVYVVARMLKASPLMALSFAVLPPLIAYVMQHPESSERLVAFLP